MLLRHQPTSTCVRLLMTQLPHTYPADAHFHVVLAPHGPGLRTLTP